jgi:hypothetical protein
MTQLKVMPQEARFWDSSSNKMVVLFNMLKAIAGHERYQEQEGKTGNLHFNTDAGSIH